MSFGLCPFTGKTFADKFPASVYEALPSPSPVTSEVQFQRALAIETGMTARGNWKRGAKKYLFFHLNDKPDGNSPYEDLCLGSFYDRPDHVRDCVFTWEQYPSNFRWFVIDVESQEEMEFINSQMCWDDPASWKNAKDEWWFEAFQSHNLKLVVR